MAPGECDSDPCQNGATCREYDGSHICLCLDEYHGHNCELDINIGCGYNSYTSSGELTSPNYPNNYDSGSDCYYLVRVPTATSINLTIQDFVSELNKDVLEYGEGSTIDLTLIDNLLQGDISMLPSTQIVINGNQLWINWNTDRNIDLRGWNITYIADIDSCFETNPCQNGGTCLDGFFDYSCMCPAGYSGSNCETDIDECMSDPCMNGGTCIDGINGFTCMCALDFTGNRCENDIDECSSDPCMNGGTCMDGVNSYNCLCPPGYTGTNCGTDIDECASTPCQNGGECMNQINSFECICAPGFTGTVCDMNIDECMSDPCQNGGTCVDGIAMYTCMCPDDATGTNCETSLDACRSDPCVNGATCTNDGADYECSCPPGFAGMNCENDINECSSLPCQNGGTCVNGLAMFTCQCRTGYSGDYCQNVDFCDLEGEWYNECNDRISIERTATGMLLGTYTTNIQMLTGVESYSMVVGFADNTCAFPTFGFTVSSSNGESTTSWTGQCHLCDEQEVLYTTWINSNSVNTCCDISKSNRVGQDRWTRYMQSQAPAQYMP
ncbi:fibropellin-3-like [Diadema antillarum]|uniref:fibropellin-3-like n=1 Tax=Diadema antillarum TaxID=105358 RepID=UPI003A88B50C